MVFLPLTVNCHICVQGRPAAASPCWGTNHTVLGEANISELPGAWDHHIILNTNINKRTHLSNYLACQTQTASLGFPESCTHRSCSSTPGWFFKTHKRTSVTFYSYRSFASRRSWEKRSCSYLSCLMRTARTGLVNVNSSTNLSLVSRTSRASSQIKTVARKQEFKRTEEEKQATHSHSLTYSYLTTHCNLEIEHTAVWYSIYYH